MNKTLLLLHGAGGGAWQWRDWTPVLAGAGFSPEALELQPGDAGLAETRLEDYLAQVTVRYDALRDQGRGEPAIIGASLGGLLAALLATRRRPIALVLVNPVPPAKVKDWKYRRRVFPRIIPWSRDLDPEATRASMPEATRERIEMAHAHWRDESGLAMHEACTGIEVPAPGCPTLVLCGGTDTSMPPEVCQATAVAYGAEHRSFPGVSHVGALLGPAAPELARAAADWLLRQVADDQAGGSTI